MIPGPVVVGAGPAGLAVAATLARQGRPCVVLEQAGSSWTVRTSRGAYSAPAVVIATGYGRVPDLPDCPGADTFTGALLHSADYREPSPYAGKRVLVVGAGNSAAEIAVDLARVAA